MAGSPDKSKSQEKPKEEPKKEVEPPKVTASAKILNRPDDKQEPIIKLQQMADEGQARVNQQLKEENRMLKDALTKIQASLKDTVDQSLDKLEKLNKIPEDKLTKLAKRCQVTSEVTPMRLKMPQNTQSILELQETFNGNVQKFDKFTKTVVNPASVAGLADELNVATIKEIDPEMLVEYAPQKSFQGATPNPLHTADAVMSNINH